jgi:dCMP deaminase
MMKQKFEALYKDIAVRVSELSHAQRLKVGAVIVKEHRILSYGYNGMPSGLDNNCEYEKESKLVTKPEVIHAEVNAITKVAASHDSTEGATMFITHAPCVDCAKIIVSSGIKKVYFLTEYRDETGLNLLKNCGIEVIQG